MSRHILLIGFYNEKALGVKYLANHLIQHHYCVQTLFFKKFNSVNPKKATSQELALLKQLIDTLKPSYIGMSVMSSLYLETVYQVNDCIREATKAPIIWGGVYPTLFPEKSLDHGDYVIRGEGEQALCELLEVLENQDNICNVMNLSYKHHEQVVHHGLRPLIQNLDILDYPKIDHIPTYFIEDNHLSKKDPQLNAYTYELTCSRGCPFTCSYCSSINLKRLYTGKGAYVRFRSVDSIISELKEAKEKMHNLKVIHFWDEIFNDQEEWISSFSQRYREEIGLPFNIWGHPLKVKENVIKHLVDAGLHQIVVGIQSGSYHIRKTIFNRPETQEQIITSSEILAQYKVPVVIYDFMLQHPFESLNDLKETYKLCTKLAKPFKLQLHGLNFLPGTDIVDMAVRDGHLTKDQLDKIMYSSIKEQYDMYWGPAAMNIMHNNQVWIALIYLTQFKKLRYLVKRLMHKAEKQEAEKFILMVYKFMKKYARAMDLAHKARLAYKH
ncbi:B12-binding domain-containing radical SAM protein [Vallitalea pronyensis]|uniref:B12-binding domain-containing radical SAM protein n=1 Tax=Vallitalea pronyensis TaxID=1348613 RepID=A0A8J8MJ41_9FIRM|nr:radical SAM protein [Vallitalea pronyensis]QUI22519.1 B12-binding domain-containing radical SAM protein [Vallitalea pronyensis]